MDKYKVIVADDEQDVRCGIISKIDWAANGFEVVGDANNGEDAFELVQALRPDLLITDIKMPYIDGLELATRLQSILPSTKVVIITGFDDFEYAKKAITLNVVDYVLKPFNAAEFTEILCKVRAVMDKEAEARRNLEKLSEHFRESLPILREHFLLSLLEGRIDGAQAQTLMQTYEMSLSGKLYAVACLKCGTGELPASAHRLGLVQVSICKMLMDSLAKRFECYTLIYTEYIVAIMALQDEKDTGKVIVEMDEVCALAEKYYGAHTPAGLGYLCGELTSLNKSYRGALAALDYRTLTGPYRTVFIDDIEPSINSQLSLDVMDEQNLLRAIRLADYDDIMCVVNRLLSHFEGDALPYKQYEIYLVEIITAILRISRSFKLDMESIFGPDFDILGAISSHTTITGLSEWLTMLCLRVSACIRRERQNNSNLLVKEGKEYAQDNFRSADFSVDKMCQELHVSPSYFSSIFKRTEGENFVNYLTTLRMNEAVRLLTETDKKTYIIANEVGISDNNYFSFVFKKRFGVSPSKYRSGQVEEAKKEG